MRPATLTRHAEQRASERCSLSLADLKQYLDNGLTVLLAFQKGGRHAKRLIYSPHDNKWFVVVQDGDNGGVLTVMPLDYLKNRIPATAAQKRSARKRVRDFLKIPQTAPPALVVSCPQQFEAGLPPPPEPLGWRIRIRFQINGKTCFKALPRTLPEHGDPGHWTEPAPIHAWLRDRIIEAGIPFSGIEWILAGRTSKSERPEDCLLEHLPLTPEEIDACR